MLKIVEPIISWISPVLSIISSADIDIGLYLETLI